MSAKSGKVTDKRYPRCSRAGVLRRSQRDSGLIVSTGALYAYVGPVKYLEYLPLMRHATNGGPTPESAEKFLETL